PKQIICLANVLLRVLVSYCIGDKFEWITLSWMSRSSDSNQKIRKIALIFYVNVKSYGALRCDRSAEHARRRVIRRSLRALIRRADDVCREASQTRETPGFIPW